MIYSAWPDPAIGFTGTAIWSSRSRTSFTRRRLWWALSAGALSWEHSAKARQRDVPPGSDSVTLRITAKESGSAWAARLRCLRRDTGGGGGGFASAEAILVKDDAGSTESAHSRARAYCGEPVLLWSPLCPPLPALLRPAILV